MPRDRIYAADQPASGPFEFNDAVARVFPDMLERSIPGYRETIAAIAALARLYVQPDSTCYDLGCSLGAATLAMRQHIEVDGCRIVAVDNAAAMVNRCRELLAADQARVPVEVRQADVRDVAVDNASMVVLNYTLQFIPPDQRRRVIDNIAAGLREGGVLVLSEKVRDEDPALDALLVELHHDFKRRNAYSDLEIARKRTALENVLVPDTMARHRRRLAGAGFRHTGVWLRWFNFVSIVAVK